MKKQLLLLAAILCFASLAWAGFGYQVVEGPVDVEGGATCSTSTDTYDSGTSTSVFNFGNAGPRYFAWRHVSGSTHVQCSIDVALSKAGTPSGTLTAAVYSDSGSDTPGSIIGTASDSVGQASVGETKGTIAFTGMSASKTSGTTYWRVLVITSAGDGSNYYVIHAANHSVGESIMSSTDGTTWGTVSTTRTIEFTDFSE